MRLCFDAYGKSTVIDAIKLVFNQQLQYSDKSALIDLFNNKQKEFFYENPEIETLPSIYIELEFRLESKGKNSEYFFGENNSFKKPLYGLSFLCEFDDELGAGLEKSIAEGKIPYEYYKLQWQTFAGHTYNRLKKPFNYINIDTSMSTADTSFNYYNRSLFSSLYEESQRMNAKNLFRDKINEAFENLELEAIDSERKFGINNKKMVLESMLSVYEGSIALENKGKGMENLIKTDIALKKNKSKLDLIVIEEPENHLCPSNLKKMIKNIQNKKEDAQIIIATHSNLIASQLDLSKVHWITSSGSKSLSNIEKTTADFFIKAEDNSFLKLLLSRKAILVEGPTEALLVPKLYEEYIGSTLEEDQISVISCNGISYKRYTSVVKDTEKKILVLTDNDKDYKKIETSNNFNEKAKNIQIKMSNNIENEWTWEAAFHSLNEEKLKELIPIEKDALYLVHGKDFGKLLGKMLNNKVDTAYKMLVSEAKFNLPKYLEEAFLWISK